VLTTMLLFLRQQLFSGALSAAVSWASATTSKLNPNPAPIWLNM